MPDIPMPQWNVSNKPATKLLAGRPDLLRKVQDIYARDFELYGY